MNIINDRYQITGLLGRGSQGEVYGALDTKLGREVAIKLLRTRNAADPSNQPSLRREALVMASIEHSNIVGVFDYGFSNETETPFLVMQYVRGECLDSLNTPLSLNEIAMFINQIGGALHCAHTGGIIHRDLKPANLMVQDRATRNPQFMVLDLGIAKLMPHRGGLDSIRDLTYAGHGTPFYMAPEQITGKEVDFRVDLYSLGVILYELVSGESPFAQYNHSLTKLLEAVTSLPPRPLRDVAPGDCPPMLHDLIMQCLSKAPESRPSSMLEVIERANAAMPITSLPIPQRESLAKDCGTDTLAVAVRRLPSWRSASEKHKAAVPKLGILLRSAFAVAVTVFSLAAVFARHTYSDSAETLPASALRSTPVPIHPTATVPTSLPKITNASSVNSQHVVASTGVDSVHADAANTPATKITPNPIAPISIAIDEEEELICQLDAALPSGVSVERRFEATALLPSGATLDANSGEFRWTPTESDGPGRFEFEFQVTAEDCFATVSLVVDVNEVNQPPTIDPVAPIEIAEGESMNVRLHFQDADLPTGDLTASLIADRMPKLKFDDETSTLSWTPEEQDGPGLFNVEVVVSDGVLSSSQTLTISVTEVHRPPTLQPVPDQSGQVGARLEFQAVASNDDIPQSPVRFALKDAPEGMKIDSTTGLVSWTPGYRHLGMKYEFSLLAKARSETIVSTPVHVEVNAHTEIETDLGIVLHLIEPGEFTMGSPSHEALRDVNETQHTVAITRGFLMAAHETTRAQFAAFVRATQYRTTAEQRDQGGVGFDPVRREIKGGPEYYWRNPGFTQDDSHPVVNVSWTDANEFCEWLSQQEGYRYRLPTEAEWEYAIRAGSSTPFSFGTDLTSLVHHGNFRDSSAVHALNPAESRSGLSLMNDGYPFTSPVGSFRANRIGLFDLHGNVTEWCSDWYQESYYEFSPKTDPKGPNQGSGHVCRGGAWSCSAGCYRSAARRHSEDDLGAPNVGFRVVREIECDAK